MMAELETPEQIRAAGLKALAEALGPDGMIRFLLQFDKESGDYTAERQAWVEQQGLDEVLRNLEDLRQRHDPDRSTRPG